MLSLQEAMQLDFTGGLMDMDGGFGFGFGFDAFGSESGHNALSAGACELPAVDVARVDGEGEEDEQQRRLRRKISNRESARRSRARKQRRVEELELAAEALRAENRELAVRLGLAVRRAHPVSRENARLQAEAAALRRRLGQAQGNATVLLGLSRMLRAAATDGGGVINGAMHRLCPLNRPAA